MSIVSEIFKARDELFNSYAFTADTKFAYVVNEDRVRPVAEEICRWCCDMMAAVDDVERAIRAGTFRIGDIPLIVQYPLKAD